MGDEHLEHDKFRRRSGSSTGILEDLAYFGLGPVMEHYAQEVDSSVFDGLHSEEIVGWMVIRRL